MSEEARGEGRGRGLWPRMGRGVHAARDVLARAGLREEGVEGVVAAANRLVGGHLAVGLDAVLEAVELPARVTALDAGLAKVDRDNLTLAGAGDERNGQPEGGRAAFRGCAQTGRQRGAAPWFFWLTANDGRVTVCL